MPPALVTSLNNSSTPLWYMCSHQSRFIQRCTGYALLIYKIFTHSFGSEAVLGSSLLSTDKFNPDKTKLPGIARVAIVLEHHILVVKDSQLSKTQCVGSGKYDRNKCIGIKTLCFPGFMWICLNQQVRKISEITNIHLFPNQGCFISMATVYFIINRITYVVYFLQEDKLLLCSSTQNLVIEAP